MKFIFQIWNWIKNPRTLRNEFLCISKYYCNAYFSLVPFIPFLSVFPLTLVIFFTNVLYNETTSAKDIYKKYSFFFSFFSTSRETILLIEWINKISNGLKKIEPIPILSEETFPRNVSINLGIVHIKFPFFLSTLKKS